MNLKDVPIMSNWLVSWKLSAN